MIAHEWVQVLWRWHDDRGYQRGWVCRNHPEAGWGLSAPDRIYTLNEPQWKWWLERADNEPWTPWPEPGNAGPYQTERIEEILHGRVAQWSGPR